MIWLPKTKDMDDFKDEKYPKKKKILLQTFSVNFGFITVKCVQNFSQLTAILPSI